MSTFTIIYKSGAKVQVTAEKLKLTRYANGRKELEWESLKPHALLVGVDDIAAIWEGKV